MSPRTTENKKKKKAKKKSRPVQWAEDDSNVMPTIVTPRETDVLLGRGNGIANYPGNILFRGIVWNYRDMYANAYRNEKRHVAELVVKTVGCLDPPGRFLRPVGEDGDYALVPEIHAVEKSCQALREKKITEPNRDEYLSAVTKAIRKARDAIESPKAKPPPKKRKKSSSSSSSRTKKEAPKTAAKARDNDSDYEDDSVEERAPKKAKKAPASKPTKTVAAGGKTKKKTTTKKDKAPAKTTRKLLIAARKPKKAPKIDSGNTLSPSDSEAGNSSRPASAGEKLGLSVKQAPTNNSDSLSVHESYPPSSVPSKFHYFNSKVVPIEEASHGSEHSSTRTAVIASPRTAGIPEAEQPDELSEKDDIDFDDGAFRAQIGLVRPQAMFRAPSKVFPQDRKNFEESLQLDSLSSASSSDQPNPTMPGDVDNMFSMLPPHLTAFFSGIFSENTGAATEPPGKTNHNAMIPPEKPAEKSVDFDSPTGVAPEAMAPPAPRLEAAHSLFLDNDEDDGVTIEDLKQSTIAAWKEWGAYNGSKNGTE